MKRFFLLLFSWMLVSMAHATIIPSSTQMWWGYFNESDADNLPYDGHLGLGQAATIDVAIYVPGNDEFVGGSTIKAIRFWLGNDYTSINSDLTVWISTSKPSSPTSATYYQTISKSTLVKGENAVELSTPFVVNNQAIYVGFTFSIGQRAYPLMGSGKDHENGWFIKSNFSEWENLYGNGYGNLALQVLIDGGNYPANSMTVEDFGQYVVQKGNSVSVPVRFTNKGKDPITSFTYTIASEGSNIVTEETVNLGYGLTFNSTVTQNVGLSSDEKDQKSVKTITVTKVNGMPNESSQKSAIGNLVTISEIPTVVPVVEEFTGTWCGYCPYGLVGMHKAHETYGDKVVLLGIHSGDVMATNDFAPVLSGVSSFPSAKINRKTGFYPSSNSICYYIEDAMKAVVPGSLKLTATWTDADKTAINFKTNSKFVYDDNNGQYGIAFALVEDGLTGSSYDWAQANYLSGRSGDDDMKFWYNSGSSVSNYVYDHVAVAAWDIQNGVDNSVNPVIRSGEIQTFSYNGSIKNNTLIQDKTKLKAVALLIDRISGTIINAAQAEIVEGGLKHDVNSDGKVDSDDVAEIVNAIMNNPSPGYSSYEADVNGDGKVNIEDVVKLLNIILGKE